MVDGKNIVPGVLKALKMMDLATQELIQGDTKRRGYTGEKITDVVNIGIGGSDLGPRMVVEALSPFRIMEKGKKRRFFPFFRRKKITAPKIHFVSNIDGTDLQKVLNKVNPKTTIFIIVSKTFTTIETMTNADTAKIWFLENGGTKEAIKKHFWAVSVASKESLDLIEKFGIDKESGVFEFWDWVGGRYSVWSSAGLSVMCHIGYKNFRSFLDGAHAMDNHFKAQPLEKNMPVIMALMGILNINDLGFKTQAILPYDHDLGLFPKYLQQLDMESNGKRATKAGAVVKESTGPVVWGEPGTDAQHSFFQHLHQGTEVVPADFIFPRRSQNTLQDLGRITGQERSRKTYRILFANFVAQTESLAEGSEAPPGTTPELKVDRFFEGNRPTNSIMLKELNPKHLGALIALYEHKIFVQGIIWDINSFDQPGVKLGKELTTDILAAMEGKPIEGNDASSTNIMEVFKKNM